MNAFITFVKKPGVIAGILTVAGTIAALLNKPALASFFQDPATADNVVAVTASLGGLIAGILEGVTGKKPE